MNKLYERITPKSTEYKLTILILTLPGRLQKLTNLLSWLKMQSVNKPVQILYIGDNKSMSVGAKRNAALSMALGEYVCFIDDDDEVSKDYVARIFEAMEGNPPVITFNVQKYENGSKRKIYKYYKNAGRPYLAPDQSHYKLAPNHLCVWRKDIIKEPFPNISLGEDHNWSEVMAKHYTEIHHIDEVLYFYYYDTSLSETHKR